MTHKQYCRCAGQGKGQWLYAQSEPKSSLRITEHCRPAAKTNECKKKPAHYLSAPEARRRFPLGKFLADGCHYHNLPPSKFLLAIGQRYTAKRIYPIF